MTTYLNVPFKQKAEAKAKGARWDSEARKWFVPVGRDLEPFTSWLPVDPAGLVSRELTTYASFRAIEQRLPLLRIADAGESVGIDPFGRRVAALVGASSGGVWLEIEPAAPPQVLERVALVLFALFVWSAVAQAFALALRRAGPERRAKLGPRPALRE